MKKLMNVTTGLCMSGLLVACGGSSSGGGGSSNADLVELTPANVDTLSRNAANALPGCTYKSDTSTGVADNKAAVNVLFRATYNKINHQYARPQALGTRLSTRADIDETEPGDCPTDPGSYRTTGTEENGVQDARITFSDYCTVSDDDDDERLILDGVVTIRSVADVSGDEVIPESVDISTVGNGLDARAITDEGTFEYVFNVSRLQGIFGNGLEDPTEQNPNQLLMNSASVLERDTNYEYSLSDVDILSYDSGPNEVVKINGITYTDPEAGSVTVTTTPLVTDDNGVLLSGSITLIGADNSSITLSKSDTVDNSFDIKDSAGGTLGVMDCSGI